MELPKDFVTLEFLFTFPGATLATFALATLLRVVFGLRQAVFGFLAALAIVEWGVWHRGDFSIEYALLGCVNAAFVYLASVGAAAGVHAAANSALRPQSAPDAPRWRTALTERWL